MPSSPLLIDNQYDQALDIFSFEIPSGASASNPSSLYPTYTKIGSVPANKQQPFAVAPRLQYLEFARQSDGLPLASIILDGSATAPGPTAVTTAGQTLTINSTNEKAAIAAFAFYKSYKALPYSPNALQVNNIIAARPHPVFRKGDGILSGTADQPRRPARWTSARYAVARLRRIDHRGCQSTICAAC